MTILKFKVSKSGKYKGIYKKVFKILNKDLLLGLGELYDSEKSYIKDNYYYLIIEDENYNIIDIENEIDYNKFIKIKKLNLQIIKKG
tara:strand:+ start:828 stop:1088 length:261 start_codon:yes stop_codon:yes gene_type:complete